MTADENAAIMRRAYAAFNSADINTLTELFDESAVWHLPGRSRFADDYQGREATLAYFGQLGQETGGTFQAERSTCLQMTRTAWSASSAAARSETASTWMLATASSSSSRTAGLLTVGSTFTTSTLGTSSGHSPAGAGPAGHAAVRGSTYIDARRSGFRTLAVRVAARKR
jgi:ketosteroid isomerase-like protein